MSRALKPEELEKMKGQADDASRRAARSKLDEMIPFEPPPDGGKPEATVHLPNHNRATIRPHAADPDVDISAATPPTPDNKTGDPIDLRNITGKEPNPDGTTTVDPRRLIDTLGKIGGVELDKSGDNKAASEILARRAGGGGPIPFTP